MAATRALSAPFTLLKRAAFEPLITGPLLLVLLRGPDSLRNPILDLVRDERVVKVATAVTAVKWLFALGLTSRINAFLNRLALNHWHLHRPGAPWSFDKGGKDEIILVTGGCSGFGLTMVNMFRERAPAANLVVLDISPLPAELKSAPNLTYHQADLTDTPALLATCAAITAAPGPPTVLINNAGTANPLSTLLDLPLPHLHRVFAVNTFSHLTLIQAFLPAMLRARKGHIVTLASMASFVTACNIADYAASKAAVWSLHEGLVDELRFRYPDGPAINATIVHPTWADTGLTNKQWMRKIGTITSRDEVAGMVVQQVLHGKSGSLFAPPEMGNVLYGMGFPVWLKQVLRRGLEKTTEAY